MEISDLVHTHILGLHPYTPGKQPSGEGWIKLNTNELPFAPPESVLQAIAGEYDKLARYPDPLSSPLRKALAEFYGLDGNQVIIGNGSDDILNLLARAFGGGKRTTVDTFPSYSLYPVLTAIAGGDIHSIPLQEDFSLPVEMLGNSDADLLFLTCPNAPTGIRFSNEELRKLAASFRGLLVIDEAYAEFAEDSALSLLAEFDHLVITRTFSKAYGLAGLRVGYALASAEVVNILDRIRDSYNVNRLSQAGALAALQAQDVYKAYISEVKTTRDQVREILLALGWTVFPSETNFLFGAPVNSDRESGPEVAAGLFKRLEERKVLVRYFPKHPLTASFLRISIGTSSEMERFIEEVTIWSKSE
jgi:histidinol-phosphate aminotransferase